MTTPTVIIADDHPLLRVALRLGTRALAPSATIIEVDSFQTLRSAATANQGGGLVLLDLMMPGAEGLSSLQYLRETFPALRVAIVSSLPSLTWARLAEALGAVAYIHKSMPPDEVQVVLGQLLDGRAVWPEAPGGLDTGHESNAGDDPLVRLTRQELRVLMQIKDGQLNRQIAARLGISESTVKTYISAILTKLDLKTRTQAAVLAQRLLTPIDPG